MTEALDAFDALRRPDAPIAPDPAFAKRLRQRLATELQPLLTSATPAAPPADTPAIPTRRTVTMTVTPYLSVRNAAAALDFYRDAFGAVETQRLVGDDGRVGHAEITIGSSSLRIADEYPEYGVVGPETRGGPTCMFDITVADVDQAYATALSCGATSLREPADQFHGSRNAQVTDPFGHRWTLSTLIETFTDAEYRERVESEGFALTTNSATNEPAPDHQVKRLDTGDLYYFTLPVADVDRAQRFFGAVLGWQFAGPGQGHVDNISAPPGGLAGGSTDAGARLWFVVDDIHAAVARVREHGGTAEEPVDYASGLSADCTDDQGTVFSLSVPSAEYSL